MGAVGLRLRADARWRWRSWLALAALAGLLGGIAIALTAGARRSETAYARLDREHRPPELFVADDLFSFSARQTMRVTFPDDFLDRVARLPQVLEAGRFVLVGDNGGRTGDGEVIGEPDYLNTIIPVDRAGVRIAYRQKLLHGRFPDLRRPEEVLIGFTVAERYELGIGDRFELEMFDEAAAIRFDVEGVVPKGVTRSFRVVGIAAWSGEFPPRSLGDGAGPVVMTPAFARANPDLVFRTGALAVRLHRGASDIAAFRAAMERLSGGVPFDAHASEFGSQQHEATERAIRSLSVALAVIAGVVSVAAVLVIGQAMFRMFVIEASEHPTLRALGMSTRQLTSLRMATVGIIAAVSVVFAGVLAIGLSPLFPIGLARLAEPDIGLDVDPIAIGLGGASMFVLMLVLANLAAWRADAAARAVGVRRRPRVTRLLARGEVPAPVEVGTAMALESGRGRTAVPVRATLGSLVIAVSALTGAATFSSSLDHLLATPRLYGWNWDISVGDGYGADQFDDVVPALRAEPAVAEFAAGTFAAVDVNGRELFAVATSPVRGSVGPTVLSGQAPRATDEILLGRKTMSALGLEVGDEVRVRFLGSFNGEATRRATVRRMRVVGTGVLPEQSDVGLDDAAATTYEALVALAGEPPPRNFFPVRFAAGVDHDEARDAIGRAVELYTVPRQAPEDLLNFGRVDALPLVGTALVGLVALATLAHMLISLIRRRQRDLGILKTLGFTRAQVSATVACQATTMAIVTLVVGVPIGAAVGRATWIAVARGLGVGVRAVVPPVTFAVIVLATLLLVNVLAAAPAWWARRTSPASVLRAE